MYKNALDNMNKLSEKIRSGQFNDQQKSKRQSMIPRPAERPEKSTAEPKDDRNSQEKVIEQFMQIREMNENLLTKMPKDVTTGESAEGGKPEGTPSKTRPVAKGELAEGILEAANELGIDAVDLATVISYETAGTFDPTKKGPTTKWGQHKGLIQFGEPQAEQYGVDWGNPMGSQLGANGAVVAYLKDNGVEPGMGLLDIYSTINAGAPGLYERSDEAAGGAPGTVRDKVENQMAGHRKKAEELFS